MSHSAQSYEADDRLFRRLHQQASKDGAVRIEEICICIVAFAREASEPGFENSKCTGYSFFSRVPRDSPTQLAPAFSKPPIYMLFWWEAPESIRIYMA